MKKYDKIFKETILKLHDQGKTIKELSSEYGVSTQSINSWKKRTTKIPSEESNVIYEELLALRKEVKTLKEDNEILKKGLAIFAQMKEEK